MNDPESVASLPLAGRPERYDPMKAQPICPHCKKLAGDVAWQTNHQHGLITFFHAVEGCNAVLGMQISLEARHQILAPPGANFRQ